jgi:hypothetical protein
MQNRNSSKAITFFLSEEQFSALEAAVEAIGTDKSKFIRRAVDEKIIRISALPRPEGGQIVPVIEITAKGE